MLILSKDLTLIGAGAGKTILDGQGVVDRTVIEVGPGATVALEGLSITGGHGRARTNGQNLRGQGGGITNEGDLTLTDCRHREPCRVRGRHLHHRTPAPRHQPRAQEPER